MSEKELFANGEITVHGARQNNLKGVDIRIPKKRTTVFVGLSGAGKSSLVFDTIAAQSRRELNETFPSFTQQYLPKYGQPDVQSIDHLPVAIVIEQKKDWAKCPVNGSNLYRYLLITEIAVFKNWSTIYWLFGHFFI